VPVVDDREEVGIGAECEELSIESYPPIKRPESQSNQVLDGSMGRIALPHLINQSSLLHTINFFGSKSVICLRMLVACGCV